MDKRSRYKNLPTNFQNHCLYVTAHAQITSRSLFHQIVSAEFCPFRSYICDNVISGEVTNLNIVGCKRENMSDSDVPVHML